MADFNEKAMPGLSDKQMEEFRANDKALREFNDKLIEEFRANGGKVLSGPFVGAPLLLLTTTGAKSGRPTTTPLVYTRDGDRIVIIASKAGAPTTSRLVPQPQGSPDANDRAGGRTLPGQGRHYQPIPSASACSTRRPKRCRPLSATRRTPPVKSR